MVLRDPRAHEQLAGKISSNGTFSCYHDVSSGCRMAPHQHAENMGTAMIQAMTAEELKAKRLALGLRSRNALAKALGVSK
jgi:hypothetical protein